MKQEEIERIIKSSDTYLRFFGKIKHLNWFDMSHLLSFFVPLTKEEILNIHMRQFEEDKE